MRRSYVLFASALFLAACSEGGESPEDTVEKDAATNPNGEQRVDASTPAQTLDATVPLDATARTFDAMGSAYDAAAPREVPCVDEQFARLMLFDVPSPGEVKDESRNGGSFDSFIDATAGGVMTSSGFVYARFTDSGLQKVDISDEQGFGSLDWDIAFRRYVLRVNSGVGGPGNVTVARTAPGTTFAGLTTLASDLTYRSDAYFTEDSCEYVADVGIGAPSTALSSFWSYSACLKMTHNVYVIALQNGRHVKFEVLSYYPPENQQRCDETDQIVTPSGAGNLRVRWAFVD